MTLTKDLTAPTGRGERLATRQADAVGVAVLVALTIVVAWNRLSFDVWLSRHDLLTFFLPWYASLGERLRDLDVPGWNPHVFSGTPFAGDPESGWMYLPAMLVFPFLSALTAFKAMFVLQLAVAGLSAYVFARVLGMRVTAALVAAIVYEFGPFLYQNTYCCTVRAQLATWIPLTLLGVELALRRDRWRDRVVPWFLSGFAISQMFAGWLGQGAMNGLLLVAAYIGYRTLLSPPRADRDLQSRLIHGATTGIVIVGLGLALGAAGILPRLDVNQETNIAGGDYGRLDQDHAAEPYSFAILLFHILGDGYDHRAVALGGTVIVLSLLAPALARRRFAVPYFAGLTLVVYTLTQETTPLHYLFYLIPRFESLHEHSPHQINAIVMIGPAMLSAAAVETLAAWRGQRRLLPLVGVPLFLVIVTALGLWLVDKWVGWMPLVAAVAATALIAFVVADLRVARLGLPVDRLMRLVPVALLALIFLQPTGAELVGSWARHPWDAWGEWWEPEPTLERAIAVNVAESDPGGAGQFLQTQLAEGESFRSVGYGGIGHPDDPPDLGSYEHRRVEPNIQAILVSGRPIFLDLFEIQGYNPLQLERYVDYITALNGETQNYHVANLWPGGVDSRLLDMLNVRYILVDASLPQDREDVVALRAGNREVFRNEHVIVYENAEAFPRAWIVHDLIGVNRDEAVLLLGDETIDFRQTALVEGDPPAVGPPATGEETARVTAYEPDAMTIATTATAPGLLVVSEVFESGWRAYVDGERVNILPTNLTLRGISIPAGDHVVELRYEPRSLQVGLWISGIATAGIVAAFVAAAVARLRSGGSASRG